MFEDIHISSSEDKTFLRIIYEEGEAGTHQLTNETEYNNSQVHRRFRKFEEAGVLTTETRNPEGKHWNRERFATLTDEGRTAIGQGELGNIFTPDNRDRDDLEERVQELEAQVEHLGEVLKEAEIRIKAQRWAIEESPIDLDVDEYVDKLKN
ncbi:hypothetical protein [Halopiger thermotolerans]